MLQTPRHRSVTCEDVCSLPAARLANVMPTRSQTWKPHTHTLTCASISKHTFLPEAKSQKSQYNEENIGCKFAIRDKQKLAAAKSAFRNKRGNEKRHKRRRRRGAPRALASSFARCASIALLLMPYQRVFQRGRAK